GCYYVQDASSMAITSVLRQIAPTQVRYLDACAAPGGKTTAALSALPRGSVVVANEFDFRRAEILNENIAKWGNPNVIVSRGDISRIGILESTFDIVAVDAPCSGEGMMRKDVHAREQWTERLVRQCAILQREILGNVWAALKPGGYIVYSTCTFNRTENEENVKWLINEYGATPVKINALENIPGIVRGIQCEFPCYRFIPGMVRGEGLFVAVLRKEGSPTHVRDKGRRSVKTMSSPIISEWINENVELLDLGGEIFAVPGNNADFMKSLIDKLDVIAVGTHVATIKGKDVIPAHGLALSLLLNANAFDRCEIGLDDSIRFLQKSNLTLPANIGKGIVMLTYCDRPLGFVKNLGSRANNLLPKAWCIRSGMTDISSLIKVL
ncbi:MAG: rRNA cytosine-C5-methyltransferase, partial [Muribaculaceae bacterium]|nr:rRNA cytosine-C5-methyltransferase [Muribaculaceae bacterium]